MNKKRKTRLPGFLYWLKLAKQMLNNQSNQPKSTVNYGSNYQQKASINHSVRSISTAVKQKRTQFKLRQGLLGWLVTILILLFLVVASLPLIQVGVANAQGAIELPLATRGAKIIDAKGKQVLLRGVNWFGLETESQAPHGLWSRDYKQMLSQIRSLGYNMIRLPYSVQGLRSTDISGIDFSIGSNAELEGKTPLEVMDAIITEAERQGLLILLDSHRLNNQRIPELWYGDGFSEADWINTWTMLATRYRNQKNVIGADLKNEPYGRASWGTNNPLTDWRLAAERAGNAILAVNPDWLIVVEGVENNVPGQKLKIHWKGGNLEGVRRFPVRLSKPRKLVYSPHEYGPGVYNQPWFSERSFPKNLLARWEIGFNFIATRNIAPVLIGEFGGRQIDNVSKEGVWQNKLVKFIRDRNLSFAYWSWNPNSADTGGILLDDWQTVDQPKQQVLSQLLTSPSFAQIPLPNPLKLPSFNPQPPKQTPPANPPLETAPLPPPLPNPRNSSSQSPTLPPPLPNPQQKAEPTIKPRNNPIAVNSGLQASVDIHSDWHSGFCVSMKVSNRTSRTVSNWQLQFQMNQAAINNSWNANFKPVAARQYVATPMDWGRQLMPNQTQEIGFCANKLGEDYRPTSVQLTMNNG